MIRICLPILTFIMLMSPARMMADSPERTSTVANRQLINVTIYNGGTALVHDRRLVPLNEGLNRIAWRDVSASMDPTSALLEPIGSSNKIAVLEQNFDPSFLFLSRSLSPTAALFAFFSPPLSTLAFPPPRVAIVLSLCGILG